MTNEERAAILRGMADGGTLQWSLKDQAFEPRYWQDAYFNGVACPLCAHLLFSGVQTAGSEIILRIKPSHEEVIQHWIDTDPEPKF